MSRVFLCQQFIIVSDSYYYLMGPPGGSACHGAAAARDLAHFVYVFDNHFHSWVLSRSSGHYGATRSRDFAPYENFQRKSVSVLLFINIMFYLILFKKRNDTPRRDFAIFMGFRVVPCF
ncbi:hypothetical protein [Citrobacter braakii]|uniref:hypothetical protein n=1 Tax=Citrobacter braakii TaxID=57706 RepID=UPI00351D6192